MNNQRCKAGFTLVELLVVMGIIGVLAALTMTVIPRVIRQARIKQARMEMTQIVMAIQSYDSDYSHFPVSRAAQQAANPDFTYGGVLKLPAGNTTVGTPVSAGSVLQNDQLMAVLMDFSTYPNSSTPTVNVNYQANIKRIPYLNASLSGDTTSSGVGNDLVYRDPWGNPYVVSLDLNDDNVCEDSFYAPASMSGGGLNGLILQPDGKYAFHGRITVWSAGPDGKVSIVVTADKAQNHDNVLSWR